jgi:hypothetical protein
MTNETAWITFYPPGSDDPNKGWAGFNTRGASQEIEDVPAIIASPKSESKRSFQSISSSLTGSNDKQEKTQSEVLTRKDDDVCMATSPSEHKQVHNPNSENAQPTKKSKTQENEIPSNKKSKQKKVKKQ